MQSAGKRLAKGSLVYMVGSASSKLLQLLILPLVTAVLMTDEYGYYDLVLSTVSLFLPIVTLKTIDAVFRFLFKADEPYRRKVLSTVFIILSMGTLGAGGAFSLVAVFTKAFQHPALVFGYFATYILLDYSQKASRGLGYSRAFAISGVLHTILLLGTQLVALLAMNMRVDGLLWSNIIANLGCFFYLEKYVRIHKRIRARHYDALVAKEVVKFSLPLIPNSIIWWFISAFNKYLILLYLGVGSNGIFSVANKFPQILTFAVSVFQLAWQETAIIESASENRNVFFSRVFNSYLCILFTGFIVAMPLFRIVVPHLIDAKYIDSMNYLQILLFGSIMSAFSQFYGASYIAFKRTRGAVSTTILAALVNTGLCLLLIRRVGLYAPAVSTAVAFCLQWLYRAYQMKDYFQVKIEWKVALPLLLLMTTYSVSYWTITSTTVQLVLLFVAICIAILYNAKNIKTAFRVFRKT